MPIDRQTAISVAKRHKLTLADAMALLLAADEEDAEAMASEFAPQGATKTSAQIADDIEGGF